MSTKALKRELFAAVVMLMVAAIALSGSTYAWFSSNNKVTATGMTATATTPLNLLINDANTESPSEYGQTANADETFVGKLYPASSLKGLVFNAVTEGNVIGENGIGGKATDGKTEFQITSDQTGTEIEALTKSAITGYWVEYTYNLKLTQAQKDDVEVYLKTLSITNGAVGATDPKLATVARVAIYDGAATSDNFKGVYAIKGASAKDDYKPVTTSSAVKFKLSTAADTTTMADYHIANDSNEFAADDQITITTFKGTDNSGTSDQVKPITIRVWIEGEDANCINANAGATFGLVFEFATKE